MSARARARFEVYGLAIALTTLALTVTGAQTAGRWGLSFAFAVIALALASWLRVPRGEPGIRLHRQLIEEHSEAPLSRR